MPFLARSLVSLSFFSLFAAMNPVSVPTAQAEEIFPHQKTFVISAYYSPLRGQEHYATGNYESDIRLNGNGTNGADGTPVYAGMVAAPKIYPFGTKLSIPGVGVVAVHDRGGAIVPAGERGFSYDRLDIWMGYGDAGLRRALSWGLRTVEVTVYGVDPSIKEEVYLEGFSAAEAVVRDVILAPDLFPDDLWVLSESADVARLQETLRSLGHYSGEVSGRYDEATRAAVVSFQIAEGVIQAPQDFGAGHTGPSTRRMLDLAVARFKEEHEQSSLQRFQKGLLLLEKHPDLNRRRVSFTRNLTPGDLGDDVSALQEELRALGLLRVKPTGYYGPVTEHAVLKFQQRQKIVGSAEDSGAGLFGPETRSQMNRLLDRRLRVLTELALAREGQAASVDAPVSTGSAGPFTMDLTLGDRGPEVHSLQSLLKTLGFFKGLFLTDFFGEQTRRGVIAFQLANALISDETSEGAGTLTSATRTVLNGLTPLP